MVCIRNEWESQMRVTHRRLCYSERGSELRPAPPNKNESFIAVRERSERASERARERERGRERESLLIAVKSGWQEMETQ